MENKIVKILKQIEKTYGEDSFEVSNYSLATALGDEPEVKILYNEGDLTKNFVLFVTHLLSEKFKEVDEIVIQAFGETLKTDPKNFKQSYQNKPSSIKEVHDGVFLHTNLSKILMESLIVDIVRTSGLVIKFYGKAEKKLAPLNDMTIDEITQKYKNMSELVTKDPELYRQIIRTGKKQYVADKFRPKLKWTQESLISEAMKYESKSDFRKHQPHAYMASCRLGILDVITKHFEKEKKPNHRIIPENAINTKKKHK